MPEFDPQPYLTDCTRLVLSDIDQMVKVQDEKLSKASVRFWHNLSQRHRGMIEKEGFENFKRTLNFSYGQWRINSFHGAFIRKILRAFLRRRLLPRKIARVDWPDSHDLGRLLRTGSKRSSRFSYFRDRMALRAYAFYCGLLWEYASLDDRLGCLDVAEPKFGHPMPVFLDGKLISMDIALSSLDLNTLARWAPLKNNTRVLEIGAGYGRLAYLWASLFPDVEYTIVDIPPALAVSQNYLAAVFGESETARFAEHCTSNRKFNFLLPDQLEAVPTSYFDFVVNVSSFDEMDGAVAQRYLQTIDRVCNGHLYVNGYSRIATSGTGRRGLNELSYPDRWEKVSDTSHDLFPAWTTKIFKMVKH